MNRDVQRAQQIGAQIDRKYGEIKELAANRARHIQRAAETMGRQAAAEALGVSVSAIHKACALARDPATRGRWRAGQGADRVGEAST